MCVLKAYLILERYEKKKRPSGLIDSLKESLRAALLFTWTQSEFWTHLGF